MDEERERETGFPEVPAEDEPGNREDDPTPHSSLNNPVDEPEDLPATGLADRLDYGLHGPLGYTNVSFC